VPAGVGIEWYTRLEKGYISGVSPEVLDAVVQAVRLDQDECTYVFDLAHAVRHARRAPSRRNDVQVPPRVQWLLDSMTMSAAFVRNGRQEIVAHNALAQTLLAPVFDSPASAQRGRADLTIAID
jgi:MmyB-like transcription regulator ligand binding domain